MVLPTGGLEVGQVPAGRRVVTEAPPRERSLTGELVADAPAMDAAWFFSAHTLDHFFFKCSMAQIQLHEVPLCHGRGESA